MQKKTTKDLLKLSHGILQEFPLEIQHQNFNLTNERYCRLWRLLGHSGLIKIITQCQCGLNTFLFVSFDFVWLCFASLTFALNSLYSGYLAIANIYKYTCIPFTFYFQLAQLLVTAESV